MALFEVGGLVRKGMHKSPAAEGPTKWLSARAAIVYTLRFAIAAAHIL